MRPALPTGPRAPRPRRAARGLLFTLLALWGAGCAAPDAAHTRHDHRLDQRLDLGSGVPAPGSGSLLGPLPAAPTALAQAAPQPAHAPAADAAAPDDAPKLEGWLGWCPDRDCPIQVYFSHAVVDPAALATAPLPAFTVTPARPGRLAWTSDRTLTFQPEPGAFGWGEQLEVALGEVRSREPGVAPLSDWQRQHQIPFFSAAGKVAGWATVPGQPRLVALLDSESGQIGRGPVFALYDQPVDPAALRRRARLVTTDGRAVPFRLERPKDIRQVWDGDAPLDHIVAVRVDKLPPTGKIMTLELPSWKDRRPATESRELEVNDSFVLLSHDADRKASEDRVPLHASFRFRFNNGVSWAAVEQHLNVEPLPESLYVSTYDGETTVWATLAPGATYRLSIGPELTDILGNPLRERFEATWRAADLPPSLALPAGPVLLEAGHAALPIRGRNLRDAEAHVYGFDSVEAWLSAARQDLAQGCAALPEARRLTSRRVAVPRAANTTHALQVALDDLPGARFACVDVTATGTGSERTAGRTSASALVQTTALGVTAKLSDGAALAWVTRLSDGQPLAAAVALHGQDGQPVSQAAAGEDGVARLDGRALLTRTGPETPGWLVARAGDEITALPVKQGQLAEPWQFGLRGDAGGPRPLSASVFTERGVYRPGETAHLQVIVRDAETRRVPRDRTVRVMVKDPADKDVLDQPLTLDAFGTAHLELPLGDEAPVGRWSVEVTQGARVATHRFQVEEYRVPTFEVKVAAPAAGWALGAEVQAAIEGRYLHGGDLAGRQVDWTLTRTPEAFEAAAFPRYVFGDASRGAVPEALTHGAARLDGQGRLTVAFKPDQAPEVGPMRYQLEARVTDVDRQAYAGRLSRVVHPTAFYLGMARPLRHVLPAGETVEIPVAAVSPEGAPVAGVKAEVVLERTRWDSVARVVTDDAGQERVERVSQQDQQIVQRCRVVTKATGARCRFTLSEAGSYQVRARATDPARRPVEARFNLVATGSGVAAWPRFEHERVEVIADKAAYLPGETARLTVQSPWPSARALVTVERDGVLEHRVQALSGDAPAIEVPVTAALVPNAFVSVTLLKGRTAPPGRNGLDLGAPALRLGYAALSVAPAPHRLAVEVTPGARVAAPGDTLPVELAVTDAQGRPAAGQAVVMVVDEAVLGLTGMKTPDPVAGLFRPEALGVRTAESRLELPAARRARHDLLFPGGDGEDFDEEGEADGARAPVELRNLFQSTAFYAPAVAVGADGRARVDVTLPDNLTSYRVMAVVVDAGTASGSADARVTVKKPLMVSPVLPRFVHPGDRLRVGAQLFNGTAEPGEVTVRATLTGLTTPAGQTTVTLPVVMAPANGSALLELPVEVAALTAPGRGEARLRLEARMGAVADAVEVTLPVLNPGSKRRTVVQRQVAGREQVEVELPADRQPGTARLEVVVSSTMLSELKDAVGYLMDYPYGCIEQTTSTAYPLVMLRDLLPDMGVTVDLADLQKFSEAGVKRLLSFQTTSGGLSYWPGEDTPHAFGTAFGLTALIEAKRRGYDVPNDALAKMADYLEAQLRQGAITGEMPHGGMADGDTRAFFAMTLGRLGRPQHATISALWDRRAQLTPFGLSFLGVAAAELPSGDQGLLEPIMAEVHRRAKQTSDEAWYEGEPGRGYSMGSPLRTHAAALLASSTSTPARAVTRKLLLGLLNRKQGGLWGNTQENVFGIMAVAALASSREADGAPALALEVNGRAVAERELEAVTPRVRRLSLTDAQLDGAAGRPAAQRVTVQGRGDRPLYVTVRAEYEVQLTPANRAAHGRGFTVERVYETLDGQPLTGPLALGSLVRVRLRVTTPDKRNYVALDDRLPAGLEALNANLATTETVAQGPLTDAVARGLQVLSYSELRDARVMFFVNDLPPGTTEYVYVARATTPGRFLRPAATVEAMYQTDLMAATAIDEVEIR